MSDFFDNFLEIGLKEGLISQAEVDKPVEKKSDSIKEWELLYGISEKSGRDLIEEAHPEFALVMPSHDKTNGVIENIFQQSDLIKGISKLYPSATNAYQIYAAAQNDLVNEMTKLAFFADKNDLTDLMNKTDEATYKITYKVALAPLAIAAIAAGVVSIIGVLSYAGKHPESQGLKQDIEKARDQVEDVINSDYEELRTPLSPLLRELAILKFKADAYLLYEDQLSQTLLELKGVDKSNKKSVYVETITSYIKDGKAERIEQSAKELNNHIEILLNMIPEAITLLQNAKEKYEPEHNIFYTKIVEYKEYLVDSDAIDAAKALDVLSKTLSDYGTKTNTMVVKIGELKGMLAHIDDIPSVMPSKPSSSEPLAKEKSKAEYYQDYLESPDRASLTFKEYLEKVKA